MSMNFGEKELALRALRENSSTRMVKSERISSSSSPGSSSSGGRSTTVVGKP